MERWTMINRIRTCLLSSLAALSITSSFAAAQEQKPNIDRIGKEGAMFTDYVAMQSCTSGRNAFFTGMYPLRTGMIPPQLPGSPSYLRPGTPALAVFLHDLGYTTGEFGKNHLGDHTEARICSTHPC